MVLLSDACINPVQPPSTETAPAQPAVPEGLPDAALQGSAFSISTEAFYQATIHSTNSPGRLISLRLTPERRAEMTTNHLDNKAPVLDTGRWTTLNNGNLMLDMRRVGQKESVKLEFRTDSEKLVYIGSEYGTAGLILLVKPVPEPK
jgi:hypothetical protein